MSDGFTIGEWNGLPLYRCDQCAYATPDPGGERRMRIHLAQGHRPQPPREQMEQETISEFALDFASDEARELALDQPAEVLARLRDQAPSGKGGGYTTADVRAAAEAMNQEE